MNAKDFWDFLETVEEKRYFELINQQVVEKPLFPIFYAYVQTHFIGRIFMFSESHKLGFQFGRLYYELSDKFVLVPDASFVSKSRLQFPLPDRMTSAPDLVIELVAPSASYQHSMTKTQAYLRHGTKLVWVVYPDDQTVDVWRMMPDGSLNVRKMTTNDTLSGEDVLPNFTLPVREIFSSE